MTITKSIVIDFHRRIIESTGGEHGIKDEQSLDAAIQGVYQSFDGKDMYPTVVGKATRLCYVLNTSHAFIDGNKRVAMHVLAVVLRFHNVHYQPSNVDVVEVGMAVAENRMDYEALLVWVKTQTNM